MTTPYRKKLIEVALPLEAINREAAREKSIRHGHPSTLHLWWARRPLAACRAVIFSSLVDDPSSRPDLYPTVEAQEKKRQELFRLIEELVKWENSNNETVLDAAKKEIMESTDGNPPPVYDPFCGGGSIPLEAQRLGLEAHGSDLNPVPVLINKALIEIPPKFACKPPVNPESRGRLSASGSWNGAAGLAADVCYYGQWIHDEAEKRIGDLYPKVPLPKEHGGGEATVIAWLWARTVASPNPAAKAMHVPLVRSFWLSTKAGKKVWVEPVIDQTSMTYRFEIRTGEGNANEGTVSRTGAVCLLTGSPIPLEYVRTEGKAGRLGVRLMAIVAELPVGRVFLPPTEEQDRIAKMAKPQIVPETELPEQALGFRVQNYGMTRHEHLFTNRQLASLSTFTTLIGEARLRVLVDAHEAGLNHDSERLELGGTGATAYADAIATYLSFGVSKLADRGSTLASWDPNPSGYAPKIRNTFARQTLAMTWDFAEGNPFNDSTGNWTDAIEWITKVLARAITAIPGYAVQADATKSDGYPASSVISTDPPYYDNIGYADLSDFFYAWLRLSLHTIYPQLMSTVQVPKSKELIATPFRFDGSKDKARTFFENGLREVFRRMRDKQSADYPLTVYYAFKQTETDESANGADSTQASTGWETMLEGLLQAGFAIDGTWPIRSELSNRMIASGTNALASSIVLVCRPRLLNATVASRRDFLAELRRELPEALRHLQKGNIAPVDLAQASIGPGMAVFSRYARVMENDGSSMSVRTALTLINGTLDEVLAEQEGEFDGETRWALAWFDQYGFSEGPFGVAETLSTAKNTAVSAMAESGILVAKAGKVRLLRTDELSPGWDPNTDLRFTVWEATHYLVRALDSRGEEGAAEFIARLGGTRAELARDLSYRLYTICERRKWAKDALQYNALVQTWPEANRLAATKPKVEVYTQDRML